MLKIQTTRNFEGFGTGDKYSLGEYFFSQNMSKTLFGIAPRWNVSSTQNSDTLTSLGRMSWITQIIRTGTTIDIYGVNGSGWIWKSEMGVGTWSLAYRPRITAYGNGLYGDQKNRLLYAGDRYLGMFDGGANYTTGTVSLTNGSAAVVGTGTNWGADMVNKRVTFSSQAGTWYNVGSVTDATHLTLIEVYSGTTNPSATHSIYVGWHDGLASTTNGTVTWGIKDFGSAISPGTTPTQIESFEDVILILRNNKVCRLNSDDSFNGDATAPFSMPTNFVGRAISSNKSGILMGFNLGNKGVLVLWDNYSTRSISPWIWLNSNVLTIIPYGANWVVVTAREIILTNGYTTETLGFAIDNKFIDLDFNIIPQGATIVKDWLIIGNNQQRLQRLRGGYQIFNLRSKLWEYASIAGQMYEILIGAIYSDSSLATHVSYSFTYPTKDYIGKINAGAGNPAVYITPPLGEGGNEKIAQGVKVEMGIDAVVSSLNSDFSYDIEVAICNLTRPIWGYAKQSVLATDYTTLTVNGTSYKFAKAGDMVQILEGANAGEFRKIVSIAGAGTSTEIWTLDRALTYYTEQFVTFSIMTFQRVSRHTVTNPVETKDIYFDVKNSIRGKKYLVMVTLSNLFGGEIVPEIRSVGLFYDEKGII